MEREKKYGKKDNALEKEDNESLSPIKTGLIGDKIAGGVFSKVYDVEKVREDFPSLVVKIGETSEFHLPLSKKLNIKISREIADPIIKKILGQNFNIIPDKESIVKGVAEYMIMKKYFGPDKNGVRKDLLEDFKNPDSLMHKQLLEITQDENIFNMLTKIFYKNKDLDFLPQEQTVMGHPQELDRSKANNLQAKEKPLPVTYYIFQQKIEGESVLPLSEIDDQTLAERPELVKKLLMFSLLTKKLYLDTGNLIDTRPEEFLRHPIEWFEKTANILVDKGSKSGNEKIYFVDTRLLWHEEQKFIGKAGLNLIDRLGVRSIDSAIKKYITFLQKKAS